MGTRSVIILLLTTSLGFVTGQLAGKKAMQNIDASMDKLLSNIELADEIHKMNSKIPNAKNSGPKSLSADPQL